MEQSRLSVMTDFPDLKVQPYTININGQYEWVDNYIKFGDLIEEHMGKEARDFYFENLYDLLSCAEDCVSQEEQPPIEKTKEHKNAKQGKTVRGNSRRLF